MSRSIGVALAAAWVICGCGKVQEGEPSEPVDAGTGGRGQVQDGEGSQPVDAGTGGAVPSALPEASPPFGDPGPAPPESCIPKCLWDLISACTPPPATTCESTGGMHFENSVTCDRNSGWASRRVVGGQAGTRVTLSRNGVDCLTMASGGANPVPGAFFYADASSSVSAVYRSHDGTEARCGGGIAIKLEPERPECQPWTGPDAQLFPHLACATTVPGDCSEAP